MRVIVCLVHNELANLQIVILPHFQTRLLFLQEMYRAFYDNICETRYFTRNSNELSVTNIILNQLQ